MTWFVVNAATPNAGATQGRSETVKQFQNECEAKAYARQRFELHDVVAAWEGGPAGERLSEVRGSEAYLWATGSGE